MAVYALTYDLHKPDQDYEDLIQAIKSLGGYSHRFDSFWLVETSSTATEIRDNLQKYLDSNDSLFVIKTIKHWSSWNLAEGGVDWLKSDDREF